MKSAGRSKTRPIVRRYAFPVRVLYSITTPDKVIICYTHTMSQSLYNVRKTDYFGNQSAIGLRCF